MFYQHRFKCEYNGPKSNHLISGEVEKESATAESLSADCNLIVTDDKLGSFSQLCRLQGGIQMHGMQICIMGLVIFIYLCMILMLPTIG